MNNPLNHLTGSIAAGDKTFASFVLFADYKAGRVLCASVANYFNVPVISSRITKNIRVFCPAGQLKLFKFGPAESSTLRFIRTTSVGAALAANCN